MDTQTLDHVELKLVVRNGWLKKVSVKTMLRHESIPYKSVVTKKFLNSTFMKQVHPYIGINTSVFSSSLFIFCVLYLQ